MYRFVIVAVVAYSQVYTCVALPVEDVTKGTELVFAFMIHRHGDRTPASVSNTMRSNIPETLQQASAVYGYGQLTNVGKQRAYAMGQFIRQRYGELLSPKFNRSEIYVRSTDYTRAKMTALSAMAAVYPPVNPRWSQTVNWEPVPYTVVPVKYDFNQGFANCPVFVDNLLAAFLKSPKSLVPYDGVFRKLSKLLGDETIVQAPMSCYILNDVFDSQISLGVPLSSELNALKPKLAEAAGIVLQEMYGDKSNFSIQAGPLIKEFLDYSAKVIAGEETQKVRVYSAHDLNVYAFEASLQLEPKQGVPYYTALLSLELRRNLNTGEYSVLPVYVNSPGNKVTYLQVKDCGGKLCNYDSFYKINSPYAIDVDTWRNQCGWTNDLVVDDSGIV